MGFAFSCQFWTITVSKIFSIIDAWGFLLRIYAVGVWTQILAAGLTFSLTEHVAQNRMESMDLTRITTNWVKVSISVKGVATEDSEEHLDNLLDWRG
jgi:hypothetical protein